MLKKNLTILAFVSPLILGILFFSAYPMLAALIMSFKNTKMGELSSPWVGISNYQYILTDEMFWRSLYNTLYMGILSALFGIVFSFILSSFINSLTRKSTKNFFKSFYFLPNVISAVAASILFTFLFYPTTEGLLNHVLSWFYIKPIGWFTNPVYSRFSIVLMSVWSALGYNTIIFLAGLQSVPKDLYEAAEVDGANPYRRWLYITIPYLRPIFLFMAVIGTINGMKRFTDVWLIGGTAGNPAGTLLSSVLYIYRLGFLSSEMGLATASAYILFIVILLLTVILFAVNRGKTNFY